MDEQIRKLRRQVELGDTAQVAYALAIAEERSDFAATKLNYFLTKLIFDVCSQISVGWFGRNHYFTQQDVTIRLGQKHLRRLLKSKILSLMKWGSETTTPDVTFKTETLRFHEMLSFNDLKEEHFGGVPPLEDFTYGFLFGVVNGFDQSLTFSTKSWLASSHREDEHPGIVLRQFWPELSALSSRNLSESAGLKVAVLNWSRTFKRKSKDRRDRFSYPQELVARWVVLEESGYFKKNSDTLRIPT